MFHSAKIAQLTEQLDEAQAALSQAREVADKAEAKVAELMAQIEAKDGEISSLKAELESVSSAKSAELEKLRAEYETKLENSVQQKVIERCASAGIEPIELDSRASDPTSISHNLKGRARAAAAFAAQFSK